mgnify:CR=1 FL=1
MKQKKKKKREQKWKKEERNRKKKGNQRQEKASIKSMNLKLPYFSDRFSFSTFKIVPIVFLVIPNRPNEYDIRHVRPGPMMIFS